MVISTQKIVHLYVHSYVLSVFVCMQVKDSVGSPGGTTIHGLQKLEEGGVRAAFMAAVKAATDRATGLKPK